MNQISMFDYMDSEVDVPEKKTVRDYAEEAIMHGTGFVGGKDRVVKLYQTEKSKVERTKQIKSEYGLGGAGWTLKGYGLHGYETFTGKGIEIQYREEDGEHESIITWSEVEDIIGSLIDRGMYHAKKGA